MATAVIDLNRAAVPEQRASAETAEPPADLAAELAARVPGARPVAFRRRWWDGAAWTPVLVADLDGERRRLVPDGEQVLVLPGRSRAARRAVRDWRDGLSPLPAVPAPLPEDPDESVTRLVVLPAHPSPRSARASAHR